MSDFTVSIAAAVLYLVLAPFLGGLLSGLDRILSARMQRRVGPPLLQPFYDVLKLWEKQPIAVNKAVSFYIGGFLLFVLLTGVFFFTGGDILLAVFHAHHGQRLPDYRGVRDGFSLQSGRSGTRTGTVYGL
jgi:ech hydrogenase subunit B